MRGAAGRLHGARPDLARHVARAQPARSFSATSTGEAPTPANVLDLLDRTVLTLAAFGGLASESMTRGKAGGSSTWAGELERSLHTIGLLQATLVTCAAHEGPGPGTPCLEILDSSMTYRRRYLSSLRSEAVLDLVVEDESDPRALAAQLAALADDVDHLPRAPAGRSPEQRFSLAALDVRASGGARTIRRR